MNPGLHAQQANSEGRWTAFFGLAHDGRRRVDTQVADVSSHIHQQEEGRRARDQQQDREDRRNDLVAHCLSVGTSEQERRLRPTMMAAQISRNTPHASSTREYQGSIADPSAMGR